MMFKESFKYYKSKNPPPNLKTVLDFNSLDPSNNKIRKLHLPQCDTESLFFGFRPLETWKVYEVIDRPGILFIKNPFTNLGQRYWTVRCLKDYTKRPNKSNIDSMNFVPENKDWWDMCQSQNKVLLDKLRWITLGYHHNWDTKVYSENNRGAFPEDLKNMTSFLAHTIGHSSFSAEAAIVNYYHMDSTLSGHTDHSEKNLEAPLFSLSFGQTAIFLIGGRTLEDSAFPMFLHSGDIVVMSKESRLCYHGVPKILPDNNESWFGGLKDDNKQSIPIKYQETINICQDENAWKPFGDYLSHSRININVRQVLYEGELKFS